MPSSVRAAAALACVAWVAFLAVVLTQDQPAIASGVVGGTETGLAALGAPAFVTEPGRVEFVLNAAMFSMAVLLAAVALPRHRWVTWAVYGLLASVAVEVYQGLFLSLRSAQVVDVVANSLGALVGAALSVPVIRFLARET